MTNVPPVTYRIEERSTAKDRVVLGTWGRHTADRDAAIAMFTALLVGHGLFHPHGPRRLVLLASPANSAPLNAAAVDDLRTAVGAR